MLVFETTVRVLLDDCKRKKCIHVVPCRGEECREQEHWSQEACLRLSWTIRRGTTGSCPPVDRHFSKRIKGLSIVRVPTGSINWVCVFSEALLLGALRCPNSCGNHLTSVQSVFRTDSLLNLPTGNLILRYLDTMFNWGLWGKNTLFGEANANFCWDQ